VGFGQSEEFPGVEIVLPVLVILHIQVGPELVLKYLAALHAGELDLLGGLCLCNVVEIVDYGGLAFGIFRSVK
jgi:hypothetical protein